MDLGAPVLELRGDDVDGVLRGFAEAAGLARPPCACLRDDSSSANATEARGRMTAITEMSLIFSGSAYDFRCLAAASDWREPSVATMTCMSGFPPI